MIPGDSLDSFRRCAAPSCEWQVQSPFPVKCWAHGGPRYCQYLVNDEGEIIASRFLPGSDADEPWEL